MAKNNINIILDTSRYIPPTEEDIRRAKQYILSRSDTARAAQQLAGDAISDAAEKLVEIAYRYNIPPQQLSFDSSVNSDMMDEVTIVMDELEEEIMAILEDYALRCTDDPEEQQRLLLLLSNLGHHNMGMRDTVHSYLWRFLHQTAALSAASLIASLPLSQARTRIRTAIRSVNNTPEFIRTGRYRQLFASPIIRNGGQVTFPDGTPNRQGIPIDGYNAIMQIYGIAIAQIWAKNQIDQWQEDSRLAGYYQLRGSNYPCTACDDAVGFYPIEKIYDADDYLVHPHCCCYRVPVYTNENT